MEKNKDIMLHLFVVLIYLDTLFGGLLKLMGIIGILPVHYLKKGCSIAFMALS